MGLTPEEALLAAILRLAIKDAQRGKTECLRAEAAVFVWTVAPTIAERAGVQSGFAREQSGID